MRALVLSAALLLTLGAVAYPEEDLTDLLVPKTAKSIAMGGVFSAVPTTEAAFFGNPACFAANKSTFAFPSLDVWQYGHPSSSFGNLASVFAAVGGRGDFLSRTFDSLSSNGASGGGASAGLSMSGRGMGLGLFMTTDDRIVGEPGLERVASRTEFSVVLGMGFPIQLGSAKLAIGGDLRPFYRVALRDGDGGLPSLAEVVSGGSESLSADAFFGAALDLGANLGLGPWTLGLSVRNIAPAYPVAEEKLSKLLKTFGSGSMPDSGYAFQAWPTPAVAAGVAWVPKGIPGKVEPSMYLELGDIVDVARNWEGLDSALSLLHAGGEVKLFKILSLRGGFNGGCLSAGIGAKLLFLDLGAALFTEKEWALPGDDASSGMALHAAIRF